MAKLEKIVYGTDISTLAETIKNGILGGSISATLEDETYMNEGGVSCRMLVFERYSYMGGNRLSMSVVLLSDGSKVRLCAVTSGGSQAMFFKINTIGEEAFLDKLREIVGN